MKVFLLLAVVIVIVAAVVNAEENKQKDKEHSGKDVNKHEDRNHGKNDRNKKDVHRKKERNSEKHDDRKNVSGKQKSLERQHKDGHTDGKHEARNKKNAIKDRSAKQHKTQGRASQLCPNNQEPSCKQLTCILTCADRNNPIKIIFCNNLRYLDYIISELREKTLVVNINEGGEATHIKANGEETADADGVGNESEEEECTKEDERFKCVCKVGLVLNKEDGMCIPMEDCKEVQEGGNTETRD